MVAKAITKTNLPFELFNKGKVRDIYCIDKGTLLIITTDRISAFDVVMNEGILGKGQVLNALSKFWFKLFRKDEIIEDHFITDDLSKLPSEVAFEIEKAGLVDNWMAVHKYDIIPTECIVRGFIFGSGWKDYQKTGKICGIELQEGLRQAEELKEPLFTPSTKAELGMHDENIDFRKMIDIINDWLLKTMPEVNISGVDLAVKLRNMSLLLYSIARDYAKTRGVIICDTKFEFGLTREGEPVLVDEVLTPDSSRFWPEERYQPSRDQESFDKQFVRDYLLSLDWDKTPPPPPLPEEIIIKTAIRYKEVEARLAT